MWTNKELETRIVILEAALDWVRHEAISWRSDPQTMARIASIATQVLAEDAQVEASSTMARRRAYLRAG